MFQEAWIKQQTCLHATDGLSGVLCLFFAHLMASCKCVYGAAVGIHLGKELISLEDAVLGPWCFVCASSCLSGRMSGFFRSRLFG